MSIFRIEVLYREVVSIFFFFSIPRDIAGFFSYAIDHPRCVFLKQLCWIAVLQAWDIFGKAVWRFLKYSVPAIKKIYITVLQSTL